MTKSSLKFLILSASILSVTGCKNGMDAQQKQETSDSLHPVNVATEAAPKHTHN